MSSEALLSRPAAMPGPVVRRGLGRRLFAWMLSRGDAVAERAYGDRKRVLFSHLVGDRILEIGPGAGANLAYLPPGARWIGVEPNGYLHAPLQRRAAALGLDAQIRPGVAERTGLPSGSVDTVIGSLVLCSVHDVAATLREVQRVLRPGGRFLFLEHVAAPRGTALRRRQRRWSPLSRWACDGCHPDRELGAAVEGAGFADVWIEAFQVPTPLSIASPHIAGVAVNA
jgi:SAM-dependent methyltransferase